MNKVSISELKHLLANEKFAWHEHISLFLYVTFSVLKRGY